jgi:hypothetical protein
MTYWFVPVADHPFGTPSYQPPPISTIPVTSPKLPLVRATAANADWEKRKKKSVIKERHFFFRKFESK